MAASYDDPEMIHVGTFRNAEGLNDLAQKGAIFFHTTDRKYRQGDPLSVDATSPPPIVNTRQGNIYREGNDVVYEVVYGTAPPSATLEGIAHMLPADMRKKKFIIRKPPVKL
jgi:hypothetical protein